MSCPTNLMEVFFIFILSAAFLSLLFVILQYNGLTSLRNHITESWSDVDTELQRRHDLIPNLVAVVKGYAAHERAVFEQVTTLRSHCLAAGNNPGALSRPETELGRAVDRMLTLVENYPALKTDTHFLQLQQELVVTENRIQAARRFYNGNVRDYRNKCEMFPSNLVASLFGFESHDYFAAEANARNAPRIG